MAKVAKQPPSPFLVLLWPPPARHPKANLVQKGGKKFPFQIKQRVAFSPRPTGHTSCDSANIQNVSSLLLYFHKAHQKE